MDGNDSDYFTSVYQSILTEQLCSKIEIWRAKQVAGSSKGRNKKSLFMMRPVRPRARFHCKTIEKIPGRTGKYLALGHVAALGPVYAMTSGQKFSRPALPLSQ